jgi:pterin-4a-carbinolamine dehydratase
LPEPVINIVSHDAGGITDGCFALAAQINKIVKTP